MNDQATVKSDESGKEDKAAPEPTPMGSGAVSYVIMDDELWKNGRRVRELPTEEVW